MAAKKTPLKIKKTPAFEFVLDALAALRPTTKPMFGCTAVYVEDRIVLILRERPTAPEDNGIWLATTSEHHTTLRKEFPSLRSIGILTDGKGGETGWQNLPAQSPDFEESALRVCDRIRARDPRIGKVPKRKRAKQKS